MSRPDGDGGWQLTAAEKAAALASAEDLRVKLQRKACPAAPATAPESPVAEMVRLSAEAGLYGDMGAAAAGEPDLREQITQGIRDRINVRPVWTAERLADHLLALPALQRLVEQAAEAARLRAECERLDAEVRRLWAQRKPRALDGEGA